MKTATNEVLVTCSRHLAGRSILIAGSPKTGRISEHDVCQALTPKLYPLKLLNSAVRPIRPKWLILAKFGAFLGNLEGKKIPSGCPSSIPLLKPHTAEMTSLYLKSSADSRRKYLIVRLSAPKCAVSKIKK
jgi:hypothetical protein